MYIKLSTIFFNFTIAMFFLLFIFNFIFFIFFKRNSFINNFFFYVNMIISIVIESALVFKIYISFTLETRMNAFVLEDRLDFYRRNGDFNVLEHFVVYSTAFSDIIILLSVMIGLFCLDILGSKNYFKNINNNSIFYIFNTLVIIMVTTNNLLIMFLCFEFIFLPTVFFAYKLGYSKKIDKALIILFSWTLLGSFLVLCGLLHLYYKYNTLNYLLLSGKSMGHYVRILYFWLFLIGFSIKIPLAPLHYWLLKVHVESPTAYSIFLSGFLVKSAFYCLNVIEQIFYPGHHAVLALTWFLYSMYSSTMGMSRQTDIKRLIAWCTVQEMSFIVLFWGVKQTRIDRTCLIFIVIHALVSTYMFFLIDIIQRRYKTRNMLAITGIDFTCPQLTKYIWFLILIFSGFPLSAKFVVEWNFFCVLSRYGFVLLLVVTFTVNVMGVILFSRVFFTMLYNAPQDFNKPKLISIQKRELSILNALIYKIMFLSVLIYII